MESQGQNGDWVDGFADGVVETVEKGAKAVSIVLSILSKIK